MEIVHSLITHNVFLHQKTLRMIPMGNAHTQTLGGIEILGVLVQINLQEG